jgi:hypothetical protein
MSSKRLHALSFYIPFETTSKNSCDIYLTPAVLAELCLCKFPENHQKQLKPKHTP